MSDKKSEPKREGTMQATVKEAEQFLAGSWSHYPTSWMADQASASSESQTYGDKHIGKEDEEQEVQEQSDLKDGDGKGPEEPAAKKARIVKDNTMIDTTKFAKEILGNEKLDESRSATRAIRESKASTKRLSTMAKTAKEGEALLKELGHKDENPEGGRRRTRSQTRGTPVPPPPQKSTPSKDTPKRGRRGRPRKDETSVPEEEVKSKEVNNTEESEELPNADGSVESEGGTEGEEVQN